MSGLLKKIFGGDDEQAAANTDPGTEASGASGLLGQVSGLLGGEGLDLGQLEHAVNGLSQPELEGAATGAMQELDGSTRTDFGQLVQGFLNQGGGGQQAPAGVASGDPNALGQTVSGLLKNQGVGVLGNLFGGSTSTTGTQAGAGGLDIASLLSNPMARTVLAALVPAILNAFKNRS